MKIISSNITIYTPKNLVWEILLDFNNYHLWNPFTPKIETNLIIGNEVKLHVAMNLDEKTQIQKESLLWVKKEESIAWGITSVFPVTTERAQMLTSINEKTTLYETYDKFWGPLTPLVMLLYKNKIQNGFDACAKGLKARAEYLHQQKQ